MGIWRARQEAAISEAAATEAAAVVSEVGDKRSPPIFDEMHANARSKETWIALFIALNFIASCF